MEEVKVAIVGEGDSLVTAGEEGDLMVVEEVGNFVAAEGDSCFMLAEEGSCFIVAEGIVILCLLRVAASLVLVASREWCLIVCSPRFVWEWLNLISPNYTNANCLASWFC